MRCSGPDESLCNFGVCKPGLKPKQSCEFGHWERNFRSVFFLGKYVKMVSICFNKGHPRIWNTAPNNLHLQTHMTFVVSRWFSVAGAHPGEWRFGAAIRWSSWRIHTDSHEIASCHDPLQWERKHESEVWKEVLKPFGRFLRLCFLHLGDLPRQNEHLAISSQLHKCQARTMTHI